MSILYIICCILPVTRARVTHRMCWRLPLINERRMMVPGNYFTKGGFFNPDLVFTLSSQGIIRCHPSHTKQVTQGIFVLKIDIFLAIQLLCNPQEDLERSLAIFYEPKRCKDSSQNHNKSTTVNQSYSSIWRNETRKLLRSFLVSLTVRFDMVPQKSNKISLKS